MKIVTSRRRAIDRTSSTDGVAVRRLIATALLSLLGCSMNPDAVAGLVIAGESDAYGLSADFHATIPLLGSTTVSLPGQPTVAGTAPAPYSLTNSLASINAGVANIATLNSGILNVAASSTVDGAPGPRTAIGSSSVAGLAMSAGPLGSLMSLTSGTDVLTQTSTVAGTYGSLIASGALTVVGTSNLVVTVLGTTVLTIAPGQIIAPNTTITISGVGTLTVNEQILDPGTNGVSFAGITSNFLDLSLDPSLQL